MQWWISRLHRSRWCWWMDRHINWDLPPLVRAWCWSPLDRKRCWGEKRGKKLKKPPDTIHSVKQFEYPVGIHSMIFLIICITPINYIHITADASGNYNSIIYNGIVTVTNSNNILQTCSIRGLRIQGDASEELFPGTLWDLERILQAAPWRLCRSSSSRL